jgi:DNA invertase Pin-like site-specific DNA recombinase
MNQKQTRRVILYTQAAQIPPAETEPSSVLDQHLAEMREYAAGRGWQVVAEFSDVGQSGTKLARPGLTALRRAVDSEVADIVLVYELNRLSRSFKNLLILFAEFVRFDVSVASVKEPYFDFTRPVGLLTLYTITALTQYYRDQTAGNRVRRLTRPR